jgi:molybdopterin/thiamine biosynthesis adenylyltransferase
MREDQIQRYSRHILLPDVGGIGQRRLFDGTVVVDDLGGGTEAAVAYLAAAGVGTLVVRDRGVVEAPGFLFESSDVGRLRADAVRRRVAKLNPDVRVADEGDGVRLPPCPDLAAAAAAALTLVRTLAGH